MIINISKINLSGCSGGGGGDSKVISTKDFSITANGTTNITMDEGVDGISAGTITTNVQPTLTAATFTQNGTYTPTSGVAGFNSVTVAIDGNENRLNKFLSNNLSAVTQSDLSGVTAIKDYGFYGMYNLKTVDLPASVGTLYQSAFRKSGIEYVDVSNVKTFGSYCFSECNSLTGLTGFENYTGNAVDYMFYNSTGLTGNFDVYFKFTSVNGNSIFSGCKNLTSITFMTNQTYAGYGNQFGNPYAGCTGITYLDFTRNSLVPTLGAATFFTAFTQNYEIRVPQSLYGLWTAATNWSNASVVSHIVAYPDLKVAGSIKYTTTDGVNVTPLTAYTSANTWEAQYLSSEFDATTGGTVSFYGLELMPDLAYSGKTNLASIEIPEGVTKIGTYVDYYYTGGRTFKDCINLTSVKLPSTLKMIGMNSFNTCGLTEIDIPDNVDTFGYACFSDCHSLTSVTMSSSATALSDEMFSGCNSLSNITFKTVTPPTANQFCFNNLPTVGTLYCPAESVSAYTTWVANMGRISGWAVTAIGA